MCRPRRLRPADELFLCSEIRTDAPAAAVAFCLTARCSLSRLCRSNRARHVDVRVTPSCSVNNTAAVSVAAVAGGCVVSATATSSGGAWNALVTATFQGLSASAGYRVFYPSSHAAFPTRSTLRALGCDFETATLSATAALFLNGGPPLFTDVDVTRFVSFSSDSPAVAAVSGRTVTGRAVGSTVVRSRKTATAFQVTSAASGVASLQAYPYSSFTDASFALVLDSEGADASLLALLLGDDQSFTDVSAANLAVTVAPSATSSLVVSRNASSGVWRVSVPPGAASLAVGPHLVVQLRDSCGARVASGVGFISTQLTAAVRLTVTLSEARLAVPGSLANTRLPVAIPSSASVRVAVTFSDGQVLDVLADPRATLSVNATSTFSTRAVPAATLSGGILQMSASGGDRGRVSVCAAVPSLGLGLACATATVAATTNVLRANMTYFSPRSNAEARVRVAPFTAATLAIPKLSFLPLARSLSAAR